MLIHSAGGTGVIGSIVPWGCKCVYNGPFVLLGASRIVASSAYWCNGREDVTDSYEFLRQVGIWSRLCVVPACGYVLVSWLFPWRLLGFSRFALLSLIAERGVLCCPSGMVVA